MNFYDLIDKRQSDRRYEKDRVVSREVLERIVEAARKAPSATNSQPWHFIIVDEPELRSEVAKALTSAVTGKMNHFAADASAFIVIVEEPSNVMGKLGNLLKKRHFQHIDIGIAASYIALSATEEGLGSCIIGWVNEKRVRELLNIPSRRAVPLVISLGYSMEEAKEKKRKPKEEVYSFDSYRKG